MALTPQTSLSKEEFNELIIGQNKVDTIENVTIENFIFPTDTIENISFKNAKWSNIDASGGIIKNIQFINCELININFKNITLTNVSFNDCILKNVIMNKATLTGVTFTNSHLVSTDPNIDNNYLELIADTIIFKNTKLDNIGFYKSKGVFKFDGATLNDVSGQSLKEGSALYFKNTNAFDIDFSRSELSNLDIRSSVIKQSKANNCRIKSLILEDSILDFPIGAGNGYDSVISKNSGSVVIGASPVNNVKISGCPKDTRTIMVGGDNFNSIEVEDCSPDEIVFFKSKGKSILIKNATVYKLDFRKSDIEDLTLSNIHIKSRLIYSGAKIKKLNATNITFDDDIKIKNLDSNIEIKADKK